MFFLRQVHQEAAGQRYLGGQARALGADRILDHLHQHGLAFEQHFFDALRLGRVLALLQHIGDVQEGGALQADFNEGALHAGQHALDLTQIDVADDAAAGGAFHVQLLDHGVFQHRDPGFLRRDVDQDLFLGPRQIARQGYRLMQHGGPPRA